MEKILQVLIPGVIGILAIFFYGRKVGLSKADKIQDKAEEEIEKAYEETAKAKAETTKAQTEARINENTAKIVATGNRGDNTLMDAAVRGDLDVDSLVARIVADSKLRAQEAQKRYEEDR